MVYQNRYNGEYSHTNISSCDSRLNLWEKGFLESIKKFRNLSLKQKSKLKDIVDKIEMEMVD